MRLWKLPTLLIITLLWTGFARAESIDRSIDRSIEPPRIGHLIMPVAWWEIVKDECRKYGLNIYWPPAVMAIESQYYRFAINHKYQCFGLMQLQKDVCRIMGVTDPFDAEQNIRAGIKILARLERQYHGNKLAILKKYNPTDDGSYSREVMRAWRQARKGRE